MSTIRSGYTVYQKEGLRLGKEKYIPIRNLRKRMLARMHDKDVGAENQEQRGCPYPLLTPPEMRSEGDAVPQVHSQRPLRRRVA